MLITKVSVKLVDPNRERLEAYCSITLDDLLVVHDVKVVRGDSGLVVAMPSRKLCDHCPRCHGKNHLRARYCNNCGTQLAEGRAAKDAEGRAKLYADVVHPVVHPFREQLTESVLREFQTATCYRERDIG